jgi:tetratricopeptide (TPR) repeat protein
VAKKSNSRRQRRHGHSTHDPHQLSASQLLHRFKSLWAIRNWFQALDSYRAWTSRTGRKRDVTIEAELLLRVASSCYEDNKLPQAMGYLDEASRLDPEQKNRYLFYLGICLAKSGDIRKSRKVFHDIQDDFHREILEILAESGNNLPKESPVDYPFEREMLLNFWRGIIAGEEIETASKALRNLSRANILFSSGEDPEPSLKLLLHEPGVEAIASCLLLLFAIHKRRFIRVRNIIKSDHLSFGPGDMGNLVEIHLILLLREKNWNEVVTINEILHERGIQMEVRDDIRDEVYFHLGLSEIDINRPEKALGYFLKIKTPTPSVIHNTALLYQRLEKFGDANEYWIRLYRDEKKPVKTDPEDVKLPYISTLKYIALNFLREYEPEKALPYLEEAKAIVKYDSDVLETLRSIYMNLGNIREASRNARMLHELEPDNEEALLEYIMILDITGNQDALIPLYKKALNRDPDSEFLREGLFTCLVEKALTFRLEHPEKARSLMAEAKQMENIDPRLNYLEAFFQRRDSKTRQADMSFRKAIKSTSDHSTGFLLGKAFYEDDMVDTGLELFTEITMCDCDLSDRLFEEIVEFLAEHDDRENAELLCDLAVERKDYHLYAISDMLLDNRKPAWALGYSSRLVEEWDADEEDRFLHLLILNETGNGQQTLQFADNLYRNAIDCGNSDDIGYYKYLIKQIKSKGKFKK